MINVLIERRIHMVFYKFKAYGNTFVISEAELNGLDSFADVGSAMAAANGEILWGSPEACEGEWVLHETESDEHIMYTYYWEERSKQPLCGGMISD